MGEVWDWEEYSVTGLVLELKAENLIENEILKRRSLIGRHPSNVKARAERPDRQSTHLCALWRAARARRGLARVAGGKG